MATLISPAAGAAGAAGAAAGAQAVTSRITTINKPKTLKARILISPPYGFLKCWIFVHCCGTANP
jgi:hypothetical protein